MRPGGGKGKGSSFERQCCRELSRFIDPKGKDTLFWRSSISGGRATVERRKGVKNQTQLGDITSIHPKSAWFTKIFFIECKHYKSLDIESSLLTGKGRLAMFWRKLVQQAEESDRHPLLIAKQNFMPTLVLIDANGLVKLDYPNVLVHVMTNPKVCVCLYSQVFLRPAKKGDKS